jgi:hypothetical protein
MDDLGLDLAHLPGGVEAKGAVGWTWARRHGTAPLSTLNENPLRIDQPGQLLAQSAKDAEAGLVDRVGCHAQFGADVGGGSSVHGEAPEGAPGVLLELSPDQLEGPVQQVVVFRAGFIQRFLLGKLLKKLVRGRAAWRFWSVALPAEMVVNLVSGNGPQPATEGAGLLVPLKPRQCPRDGMPDFLNQISGVSVMESGSSRPEKQQGAVELNKPLPRVRVPAACSFEQAQ